MTYFKIEENIIVDSIVADPEFIINIEGTWVEANNEFEIGDLYINGSYSKSPLPPLSEAEARAWRNYEIQSTDFIVPLTDYPNYTAWMAYRQELRDWPSTASFPDTKPIKP